MVLNQRRDEPRQGDQVVVAWGPNVDVTATVVRVCGPQAVGTLMLLSPEASGEVVAENTTLSVPFGFIRVPEAA